ncbi:hypothetical protein ACFL0U_01920 [Pseudomonadota bacterium]
MKNQTNNPKTHLKGIIAHFNAPSNNNKQLSKNSQGGLQITEILSNQKQIFLFAILVFCLFSVSQALAGTGGAELNGAYDRIMGMITGTGGKIAMAGCFATTVVTFIKGMSPGAIAMPLGAGVILATMQSIVDSTVTALI